MPQCAIVISSASKQNVVILIKKIFASETFLSNEHVETLNLRFEFYVREI